MRWPTFAEVEQFGWLAILLLLAIALTAFTPSRPYSRARARREARQICREASPWSGSIFDAFDDRTILVTCAKGRVVKILF
jgi:hypothetical protein